MAQPRRSARAAPRSRRPRAGGTAARTKEQLQVQLALRERLLDSSKYAIAIVDSKGTFTFVNQRLSEMTGYTGHELVGALFSILLPSHLLLGVADKVAMAMSGEDSVRDVETELIRKDGERIWISFNLAPMLDDGIIIGVAGWAEDITERRRREALLSSQRRLLELVAGGTPLQELLDEIARTVQEHSGAQSSILLLDDDGRHLRRGACPGLPDSFLNSLDGVEIGPAVGASGTAAYQAAPVFTRDASTDPLWSPEARDFMQQYGLRAAWSTPIRSREGSVLGTLTMYSQQPRSPDDWHLQVMEMAAHLAGIAIQRMRVEEQLNASEHRLRQLWETTADAVVLVGADGRIEFANPAVRDIFGYDPQDVAGQELTILQPERLRESHRAAFRRYLETRTPTLDWRAVRMIGLHGDGHEFPIEVSFSDITAAGNTRFAGFIRDVTARARAEDALRASEERYRDLVENANDIVYTHDFQGVFTSVNAAGLRTYGLTPDDIGTVNIREIVDASAIEMATEAIRRKLQGDQEATTYELLTHARDGSDVWVEVSTRIIHEEGRPVGVHGIARNITERKAAEQALRESEDRYRAIFRTHGAVNYLVDPESATIIEANQSAAAFYGYTPDELAGMPIERINTQPPAEIREKLRSAVEDGRTYFQFQQRLSSGEIRDVELYTGPVAAGDRTLLFSIIHDVTQRRRAESLVSAQRELLEMIAVGASLDDVLTRLALTVEEHAAGTRCSVLLLSADGTELRAGVAPSMPERFLAACDGMPIDPQRGVCGVAASTGEEAVSTDVEQDAMWHGLREFMAEHNVRAAWSNPVLSQTGGVLGTICLYYDEQRGPTSEERTLIDVAISVARIAIERRRAEKAVRSRTAELERMYKRVVTAHAELDESKAHLEEKSMLLERALESERERARRDPLTGTLNHAAIMDVLRDAIYDSESATLALAMVDVDGLKVANDTYGHPIGDAVLVRVAEHLSRGGATVGRYGGDEFIAVLDGADRAGAEAYRDDVLASLSRASLIDPQTGASVPVVASIGLAIYPEEAGAVDDLIRLSDSAMYAARRQRTDAQHQSLARTLGGDRAAKMIGELVPLLTSPGAIDDKLRLVAHRLSVGAGYDAVHFILGGATPESRASSAFARVPAEDLERFNRAQRSELNARIAGLLTQTKRPIIIDDFAENDLLAGPMRDGLIAAGFRSALIAPMLMEDELMGALSVGSKQAGSFSVRDAEFVMAVATQVTAIVQMSRLLERLHASSSRLHQAHEETVLMLASAAEAHDHTTGRHLSRVRDISEALARELGYSRDDAHALGLAATLHDIGKIRVPDSVLGSSSALVEAEWVLMRQHTLWGAAFLAGQQGFELATTVARHHHERWDGGGYPDGIAGEAIPRAAQITTVADSLDAMTNDRPYRAGRPVAQAVAEIVRCSGSQFSPRVVDALVRLYERGELDFVRDGHDREHHHDERAAA